MNSHNNTKYQQQEELQISEFIKDPTTLKLLILAGTNIKPSQLSTVAKCTNLIKLDLSSNMLSDISISFSHFIQLKILYLHDNNIFAINISNSTVEYITLFNNPIKNYRHEVIQQNEKLLALDYHIVTKKERLLLKEKPSFAELKWPIVQASASLENEEDYLNLLKAEIFVITNLYKKATSIEHIQNVLKGFINHSLYKKQLNNLSDQMRMRKSCVLEAAAQWKNYIRKKEKLHIFLTLKGKQNLLYNNLDIRKQKRSPQANQIISSFVQSIRSRLRARRILQPSLTRYRQYIPTSKLMPQILSKACSVESALRLYFLKSQIHFLQKIFLYCKRLLFNNKQYDLCDNFEKLVRLDKTSFYVFRMKGIKLQQRSFLRESIRRTISLNIAQKNIDRKHFLYSKKGHKKIGLKSRFKHKLNGQQLESLKTKMEKTMSKINRIYESYESLVSYSITDRKIFQLLIRILKYFNAGNSDVILSNQTAYFQTEVVFQHQQATQKRQKIFVGIEFFIRRTLAANVIQKFWRKIISNRKNQIDVIKTLKEKRALNMISHWLRGLAFQQRTKMNKMLSYRKTIQKTNDVYIHLDVYMNLPHPSNLLKLQMYQPMQNASNDLLYRELHTNTYVQIIELCRRRWVRIVFPSVQKALQACKLVLFTTLRFYYNGFYLQLFNYFEAQQPEQLEIYEKRLKHLFKINVQLRNQTTQYAQVSLSKKLPIQNPQPYFVWAQVGEKGIQEKYEMQKQSVPISIFIYNKHQKPLKINCQINWLNPTSIYSYKKKVLKSTSLHGTMIRSRTPSKKSSLDKKDFSSSKNTTNLTSFIMGDEGRQHYLEKIRSNEKRDRRNSQISPHNTLLLRNHRLRRGASQHVQVDLLSQTLTIRKK